MYGILRSSLLFYRKLCGKLESYGFKINPYEPCMRKKIVMTETVVPVIDKKGKNNPKQEWVKEDAQSERGEKITVIWHVHDLMMSCKDNF